MDEPHRVQNVTYQATTGSIRITVVSRQVNQNVQSAIACNKYKGI